MKSVLLVDSGNSRIKAVVLKKDKPGKVSSFFSLMDFFYFFSKKQFSASVFSSVLSDRDTHTLRKGLRDFCDTTASIRELSKDMIHSRYDLDQLGEDRLAKLLYARFTQKNPCVLVDAGTALTVDFFSPPNVFLGGFISGGFSLEYEALSEKTKKLPRVIPASKVLSRLPKNTEEAIHQGVKEIKALGVRALIEKMWKSEETTLSRAGILLTGGEAGLLKPHFPEARVHENLVLQGLQMLHRNAF